MSNKNRNNNYFSQVKKEVAPSAEVITPVEEVVVDAPVNEEVEVAPVVEEAPVAASNKKTGTVKYIMDDGCIVEGEDIGTVYLTGAEYLSVKVGEVISF